MSKSLEEIKGKPFQEWTHKELEDTIQIFERFLNNCTNDLTKYITYTGNLLKLLAAHGITDYGFDISEKL